jgi:hypothetical protein
MAALLTAKKWINYDSSSCQGIAWWGRTAAICAPTSHLRYWPGQEEVKEGKNQQLYIHIYVQYIKLLILYIYIYMLYIYIYIYILHMTRYKILCLKASAL